jgi:hypothetical protein
MDALWMVFTHYPGGNYPAPITVVATGWVGPTLSRREAYLVPTWNFKEES